MRVFQKSEIFTHTFKNYNSHTMKLHLKNPENSRIPIRELFWAFGPKFARKKAKFREFARKCDAFFVKLSYYETTAEKS